MSKARLIGNIIASVLAFSGCASDNATRIIKNNSQFDATTLQMVCGFGACDNPNHATTRYFTQLAVVANGACIIHSVENSDVSRTISRQRKFIGPLLAIFSGRVAYSFSILIVKQRRHDETELQLIANYSKDLFGVQDSMMDTNSVLPLNGLKQLCADYPILLIADHARIVTKFALPESFGRHFEIASLAVIKPTSTPDNSVPIQLVDSIAQ